ncbi:hypothetical protein H0H93_007892, partial [Arthromyces matolae]
MPKVDVKEEAATSLEISGVVELRNQIGALSVLDKGLALRELEPSKQKGKSDRWALEK